MTTAGLPAVLLCVLAVLVIVAAVAWRRRVWLVCVAVAVAAAGGGYWAWQVANGALLVVAGVAVAVLAVAGWHRCTPTAGTVTRWGNRARRTRYRG